jgi:tetratricopeptide (TPR) repeat protein/transcriptional regulator with XRE-family HTH domain
MSRWKPLRDGLDPLVVQFVVELRRLKDGSGLNLTQLASRTGRSASSWERYLDGRVIAPRDAVESLTRLAGADPTSIMALHRTAKGVWRATAPGDGPAPPAADTAAVRRTGGPEIGAARTNTIPRAVAHLADEIQALRNRTELSLGALATETRYSKSAWGRWLSGKALPPWHAVRALCTLAGAAETDLRALWSLAENEWSRRGVIAVARAPTAVLSVVRPAELPSDPADFTGRDRETELTRQQLTGAGPDGPGAVALVAISGPGGIGKTALAVHVGHRVAGEFPDGQLFANLRGGGPAPAASADVLAGFLRSLGVPADEIPADGTGRSALFRSRTAGRRLLIVLDDVANAAQVRPLLPGSGSCAVLLTGRLRLPDLDGCHHLDLDVLPAADAAALVTRIAGRPESDPEPDAIRELVAACGQYPLALRIAGARLATRRVWTVADLVNLLSADRDRLDELVAGDLEVRATFDVSYRSLPSAQARAFRMLSTGGIEEIAVETAAALLDESEPAARRLAEALVDASLLMPLSPGRYRYHDLIRLFAQEAAERTEPGAERDGALSRLLALYRRKLAVAALLIRNGQSAGDSEKAVFTDAQQARRWLEAEGRNIVHTVVHALSQSDLPPDEPLAIIDGCQWYLRSSGSWDSYRRMSRAALDRAVADADLAAELTARQYLGLVAVLTGEPAEANAQLTRALELARAIGDRSAQAAALNRLGLLHFTRNELAEAIDRHQAALDIFRELGNSSGMCTTMINLGKSLSEADRGAEAVPLIEESLAIAAKAGDEVNVAFAEYNLARSYRRIRRHDEAIAVHRASLPKLRDAGLREGEAHTLADLGETLLEVGRPQEALTHLLDAIALLRTLGDRHSAANYANAAGRAHQMLGDEAAAVRLWTDALETLTITSPSDADEIRGLIGESPLGRGVHVDQGL